MAEAKSKLLIIEDDLDLADMLTAYFRVEGYEVFTVNRGQDGIRAYHSNRPSLVILDVSLPDIDGNEVTRQLRGNSRMGYVPIIFLSDKRERIDRLQGLELGVDGYITKPFDIQELRLRVRNVVRRASQDTLTNPITGLPDRTLVEEHLSECLLKPSWTMMSVSLENLDAFRDTYGFVASDDVLRSVSLMLLNAIREIGIPDDFLGHLDPAIFLLICAPERAASLQERIRGRLEHSLEYFYPIKDREKSARHSKRLVFNLSISQSSDGPFGSLEALKDSLSRKKL